MAFDSELRTSAKYLQKCKKKSKFGFRNLSFVMQSLVEGNAGYNLPERTGVPENPYEQIIRGNFEAIRGNVNFTSGFFPAVEPGVGDKSAYEENHMQEAWIRDWSMNIIGMVDGVANLRKLSSKSTLANEISDFVKRDITKVLGVLSADSRWTEKFNGDIVDHPWYTELAGRPPEAHVQQDGTRCKGTIYGEWDQNQPEAWGEFLLAIGKAKEVGVIDEYDWDGQMEFIETVAGYLVRIQTWRFLCTGMWEGLPGRSPTSRSVALAIAKGLDAVCPLFKDAPPLFKRQINRMIDQNMDFVRENPNTDYTEPTGHPDGADLAMLATMILDGGEATKLSFVDYVLQNGKKLGIGSTPGAKRFVGDSYYMNEEVEDGEARWFMAEPILAIGFFQAADEAFKQGNLTEAAHYYGIAKYRLKRTLEIIEEYGYPPELFKVIAPTTRGGENTYEPFRRSLLWNRALVMIACSQAAVTENLLSQN